MKVTMGDYDVPFDKHVNVGELLSKMHAKIDKKLIDTDEDNSLRNSSLHIYVSLQ